MYIKKNANTLKTEAGSLQSLEAPLDYILSLKNDAMKKQAYILTLLPEIYTLKVASVRCYISYKTDTLMEHRR